MHIDWRFAWDHGGQHGQESEEGSQEEKEVVVRTSQCSGRSVAPFEAQMGGSLRRRISAQQTVRPDPYADGCCIRVRLFAGT